jgi:hypothetical protein
VSNLSKVSPSRSSIFCITAGLDKHHRPRLISLLHALHRTSAPQIIIFLRLQDPIPDWITHIALVRTGGLVVTGAKEVVLANMEEHVEGRENASQPDALVKRARVVSDSQRTVLVDLQGVNVSYHERHASRLGPNLHSMYS